MKKTTIINSVIISFSFAMSMFPNQVSATSPKFVSDAIFNEYKAPENFNSEVDVNRQGVKFTLWSPKAEAVEVKIYNNENSAEATAIFPMSLNEKDGTWNYSLLFSENKLPEIKSQDDLNGNYYTFRVKFAGQWLQETPGIWAKAVSANGVRGAFVNLDETDPEGWAEDKGPVVKSQTDAIVYEMHHRDFSIHQNSGITNKGKFVALLENGTLSANGEKTGIDHLKELGVTHVQILPSYDYCSIDEKNLQKNIYNWGYDPQNYNAPEGSYSTNPSEPATRIREMKQMIMALHNAGIGVVMDVVYNHTGMGNESNFSLTAPGYFYRHTSSGNYSNASGCGNETASDRKVMHDFIVNSIKYWATEYHIDGFRFDLMAIHDTETMKDVAKELRAINPSALLYGEGWTAGDSPLPVERRALKANAHLMPGVGVFSDDIRDAVKGHYSKKEDQGFASGKEGLEETVKFGIAGATNHPQIDFSKCIYAKESYVNSPAQVVNYVSCHDDMCLTDKLNISMPDATVKQRQRTAKLAQTIVFTSQGMPFMFCGEEIFRDKKGVHNTYNYPDSVNAIDWNLKKENRELFDYYRNLIQLRKKHPAFRMTSAEDIAKHLVFDKNKNSKLFVSYTLKDNANNDEWKEIKVYFNGSNEAKEIKVNGEWKVIATDGKIDEKGLDVIKNKKIQVMPTSATILAR